MVEVDASDVGVGAVISQRSANDNKLHSCAFFSRHLSAAERNYINIGNRELLAIKLALKKWRHWLEGLNSQQAQWALFHTRFNFTLSYRPESRNIKPDTLSRLFVGDSDYTPPTLLFVPAGLCP